MDRAMVLTNGNHVWPGSGLERAWFRHDKARIARNLARWRESREPRDQP